MLAALVSVTTLAPGAFATNPTTADAPARSHVQASVGSTVASESGLGGALESLQGVPLTADGQLRAQVSATNFADTALEEVVLRLDLTREPLTTRVALAEFMADPTSVARNEAIQEPPAPEPSPDGDDGTDGAEQASESVTDTRPATTTTSDPAGTADADPNSEEEPPAPVGERIAPGTSTTFTLTASASELGLPSQGWGVHGATLTLVSTDTEVLVDSFALTWGADAVPQLDLAVLAIAQGVPSRALTSLEASNLPGVAIAVDPTYVTAQHLMSNALRDREVFRLPVHSPDITSIAHSGNHNLMPLALSLSGAIEIPAVTAAPWLALPTAVDTASVALAGELDAAAVLALPSTAGYHRLASSATDPVVNADGMPVLLPDATLSHTVEQFRPGTPAAAALALADSALLTTEANDSRVLVAFDSQWHLGVGSESTLSTLLSAPWVSSVPVAELLNSPSETFRLSDALNTAAHLPADQINQLGERLDDLTLLATIAESPEDALNDWGSDLIQGVSVHDHRGHIDRLAALHQAIDQAEHTLNAVRIADSSDLNLLTESGDIPVHVVNGLEHPITVTVDLSSFSPNLQILDTPTVTVPAASDQVVLVPVEAVSNANVFVSAVLRTTEAEPVSEVQLFSIRVRADWGNAATAVFTVVLVLLLIAGLIRTIRRGRKDTRVEPSTPPETMTGDND